MSKMCSPDIVYKAKYFCYKVFRHVEGLSTIVILFTFFDVIFALF